ncbi:MAG: hypothetical protein Q7R56_02095 [Nanoarchaeota archaeon]|nr:hypothetical protein [Nanoarchaeota archaeon]
MNISPYLQKITLSFKLSTPLHHVTYLLCSPEQIILRNFLGGCPDPEYQRLGNKKPAERPKNLITFIQSLYYKKELTEGCGCVITKKEIQQEIKLAQKIPDKQLRKKMVDFYQLALKTIQQRKKLILISPQKDQHVFNEVLLHELVHELVDINKLRPRSWKWNEGLVTYLTFFSLNKEKKFEKKPPLTKDKMANIYDTYTHKWSVLFKHAKNSETRRKILLKQLKKINKQ